MRTTCATVLVFFSKVSFRKFPDHNEVKVSFQQLRGTPTTAYWKTPYSGRFYGRGLRFFHQDFSKHYETKIKESALKMITLSQKIRTKHCIKIDDISLATMHFFFAQTNLVFKTKPVFIDILDSFWYSLFTSLPFDFWYSPDFWSSTKIIQCPYAFL